jgi:hypothetical protein
MSRDCTIGIAFYVAAAAFLFTDNSGVVAVLIALGAVFTVKHIGQRNSDCGGRLPRVMGHQPTRPDDRHSDSEPTSDTRRYVGAATLPETSSRGRPRTARPGSSPEIPTDDRSLVT